MSRITVLGGTGYAGSAVVAEAAKRGHDVTSVSRSEPTARIEGVDYVIGSTLDAAILDAVLPGRDVVFSALSPRGDMAGKVEGAVDDLIARLAGTLDPLRLHRRRLVAADRRRAARPSGTSRRTTSRTRSSPRSRPASTCSRPCATRPSRSTGST